MPKNWQLLRDHQKSWDSFLLKQTMLKHIRDFFWDQNFIEVDVPILAASHAQEPNIFLSPVSWLHKDLTFYLPPSPESSLKKLLGAGLKNCFCISKCVRDLEELGPTHNLEFNMLEWYEPNFDYHRGALVCQQLFRYLATKLNFTALNLNQPWHETTVKELFAKHAHINLDNNLNLESIVKTCQLLGYQTQNTAWDQLFNQIWFNLIEPNLPKDTPTIVYDYPIQISNMCAPCPNPSYGQRFEIYLSGLEFGNCYTELTDPQAQEANFQTVVKQKQSQGLPTHPIDTDLIEALKTFPKLCNGNSMGIERLAMFFAQTSSINDVVFFPTAEML